MAVPHGCHVVLQGLYPASRIVAFEPDPAIYGMLCRNLNAWGYSDVETYGSGLWSSDGTVEFWAEGADAGRVARTEAEGTTRIRTVRLSSYITEAVDMLKLDIEGAELDVLTECSHRLHLVRHLYVGYHSFKGQPQRLDALFACLSAAGFRLYIDAEKRVPTPLLSRPEYLDMDAQFGIFGYRP